MSAFFCRGGCTVPEGGIARIRPHRAGDPEAGHRGGAHGDRRGRRGRRPRLRQSRGSARERCSSACPAAAPTVTTTRSDGARAGRRRARRRAAARPARPAAARRGCARRDGACGGRVLPARPTRELAVVGCHRDEREDDHRVPALRRCSPPPDGGRDLLGTIESRVGGRAPRCAAHDAGGDRPSAHVPRDARRGRSELRDGGVLACRRAAPARLRSLPCAGVHEPDAGSPRLPRHDGRLLRREAAPLPRAGAGGAAARRRPSTSTTRTDDRWPRSLRELGRAAAHVRVRVRTPTSAPTRLELTHGGAAFQADGLDVRTRLRGRFNVANVLGAIAAARLLELPDDAIVRGRRAPERSPGPVRGRRRGSAVRRSRRLRAHTRRARERADGGARDLQREARSACSAAGATGIAANVRSWERSRRGWPTV